MSSATQSSPESRTGRYDLRFRIPILTVNVPKHVEQFPHLTGQGCFERDSRAGPRMVEGEMVSVQRLARKRFQRRFELPPVGWRQSLRGDLARAPVERIVNH